MKLHAASMLYAPGSEPAPLPDLPAPTVDVMSRPDRYQPEEGLAHAVNLALMLGQPLIVTGEPGAGKSTLSYSVAYSRFENRHLRYDVKSTTTRTDLLYQYDSVARLRDCQSGLQARPLLDYLRFEALGEGIIRAIGPNSPVFDMLGKPLDLDHPLTAKLFGASFMRRPKLRDLVAPASLRTNAEAGSDESQRWVILIDEMDKAPRDVPNDLLGELDRMEFDIPEIGVRICNTGSAAERVRPFVIITSNGERCLPNAFLRRCAYYHIALPGRAQLKKIVELRLADMEGAARALGLADAAIDVVMRLRGLNLKKPPGLSELLSWLAVIARDPDPLLSPSPEVLALYYLPVLIKDQEDTEAANQLLRQKIA